MAAYDHLTKRLFGSEKQKGQIDCCLASDVQATYCGA
jgi:hypothetical protein